MPTAICDLNTLNQAGKCFNCLSELQNSAAIVYFLEQTRAKLAGVTPRTPNQMRQLAKPFLATAVNTTSDNLMAAVAQLGAIGVGDTASSASIAAIRKASNPYANMSVSELMAMQVILRCNLNAFLFVS